MVLRDAVAQSVRYPQQALSNARLVYCERFRPYDPEGVAVMQEDWDVLIVLDACRADYLQAMNPYPGDFRTVTSRGSTSKEWVRGNFQGNYPDTTVVTGNGWYSRLSDELNLAFHSYEEVAVSDSKSGWCPPKRTTDTAIETHRDYPNKRLLVHFMQPHAPYRRNSGELIFDGGSQPHLMMAESELSPHEVRQTYIETLEYVLGYVEELIDEVTGKVVITADHGELLGEPLHNIPGGGGYWGHRYGYSNHLLRKVPWLEIDAGTRPDIIESDTDRIQADDDTTERLRQLGYRV